MIIRTNGGGAGITPAGNDSNAINNAIIIAHAMSADVTLDNIAYTLLPGVPIQPLPGVSLLGHTPTLTFTTNIPDAGYTITGGTRIVGDGSTVGIGYNNTILASPIAEFASNGLSGANFKNLAFIGCLRGIDVGAQNSIGLLFSEVENIYTYNCVDYGVNFENFLHCKFSRIYDYNAASSGGGIRFTANVSSSILLPGNSLIGEIYSYCSGLAAKSIMIYAITPPNLPAGQNGAQLNEVQTFGRIQANRYGANAATAITATITNGSNVFGIADATQFSYMQVGVAVVLTSYISYLPLNKAMFVSSRNTTNNTVTLSNYQIDRAGVGGISSATTGTITLECGGYTGVDISATPSTGIISNCKFSNLDLESSNATAQAVVQRTRGVVVEISSTFTSNYNTAIVARDAGGSVTAGNSSGLSFDFDDSCHINPICLDSAPNSQTGSFTLANASGNMVYNSASAGTVTIPMGLRRGFKCDIIQQSTGAISVAAATNVSVLNLADIPATCGEGTKITIEQVYSVAGYPFVNPDTYVITGIGTGAAASVAAGSTSPTTYINNSSVRQSVYVIGGTVSSITYSRGAFSAADTSPVLLNPGDQVAIAWTAAPTITSVNY